MSILSPFVTKNDPQARMIGQTKGSMTCITACLDSMMMLVDHRLRRLVRTCKRAMMTENRAIVTLMIVEPLL